MCPHLQKKKAKWKVWKWVGRVLLPDLGGHWLSPVFGALRSVLGRGRFAFGTFHPWSRPSVVVYFLPRASWWILERDVGVSAALAIL